MLQFSIALLFAFAGIASLAVISQALRRAWNEVGALRRAIAECETVQPATFRTYERRARPALRIIPGAKTRHPAAATCGLRAAA